MLFLNKSPSQTRSRRMAAESPSSKTAIANQPARKSYIVYRKSRACFTCAAIPTFGSMASKPVQPSPSQSNPVRPMPWIASLRPDLLKFGFRYFEFHRRYPPVAKSVFHLCSSVAQRESKPVQSSPTMHWGVDSLSPRHSPCQQPQPQRRVPPSHSSFRWQAELRLRHFARNCEHRVRNN